MMDATSASYYHCNRYAAENACEFCDGVIRHAFWCIQENPAVMYAYEAFLDASKLLQSDHLLLHALGVTWTDFARKTQPCAGKCGISQGEPTASIVSNP